jgi:multicomponent Na+:H+ antiporter subunit E
MQAKPTLLLSLFSVSAILFGISQVIHKPLALVGVSLLAFFISTKIIHVSSVKVKFKQTLKYLGWLVREIYVSAYNVATMAWQPSLDFKPAYKWIVSNQKTDIGLVLYANSITLTPGTVTIELNDNNLLIHALDASSIQDLQNGVMDNKVLEIIK